MGMVGIRVRFMKQLFVLILFLCGFSTFLNAQQIEIYNYIKTKSDIKDGGCNIFSYNNNTYVINVSQVIVGNKTETSCKTVGAAKAKRDIIAFVNGSEISSITELRTSEKNIETLVGTNSQVKQEYIEVIKESVIGNINQCITLGGWYSKDKSVYYYAIYKQINK